MRRIVELLGKSRKRLAANRRSQQRRLRGSLTRQAGFEPLEARQMLVSNLSVADAGTVNEGSNAAFVLTLDVASGSNVVVTWATINGTTTSADFIGSPSATTTIVAGQTSATVYIPIVNDSLDEDSETFTLQLNSATNANIVDNSGSATIAVDSGDTAPAVSVGAYGGVSSAYEGGSVSIQFTLSSASGRQVTVNYHTVDGTAKAASSDYTAIGSGQVVFDAGETSKLVAVATSQDLHDEPDETFSLAITSVVNASGSGSAGITIIDNDPTTPDNPTGAISCSCTCTCDNPPPVISDNDAAGGSRVSVGPLTNSSLDRTQAIIRAPMTFTGNMSTTTSVEAYLSFNSASPTSSIYFDPSEFDMNREYLFAIPYDASGLAEGKYEWTMTIKQNQGFSATTRTVSGSTFVEKQANGPFGKGWEYQGLDRLSISGSAAYLMSPSGERQFFNSQWGTGYYTDSTNPAGLKLEASGSNYLLTDGMGNVSTFNSAGLIVSREDSNGNETTYSYTDADSDSQTDDISTITDWAGRVTTFSYTSGRVTSITDFASRVTTLAYDGSSRLVTYTEPDPDGMGGEDAPETTFTYTGNHRIASFTNATDGTTAFTYGLAQTVATKTGPTSVVEEFIPAYIAAVIDTSGGVGTSTMNMADPIPADEAFGTYEHPDLGTSSMLVDRYGNVIKSIDDDGHVTLFERDWDGRILSRTDPDPDGAGALTAPVTSFTYDARGNTTAIEYPDGTTESWTYHWDFDLPLSHVDRNEHTTFYTYDSSANLLFLREVVGELDDEFNEETDDVVTEYTYTDAPSDPADPAKGLLASLTDALGRLTEYAYNADGLLTLVTFAVGTALEASVAYDYDAYDRLSESTDELGRVTTYVYDALDRLLSKTLPDPDGGGGLSAPVYTYEYDAAGRLAVETDPLGRDTIYTYNARGELTKVERPDHDSNSQLTTTTFAYDDAGQQTSITDPLGRITTSVYNSLGQLTTQTLPDPDGGGGLSAPSTAYTYDALGRTLTITDALSNVTSYAYGNYGRIVTITAPDPDGVGGAAAPVTEMTYDAMGQLVSSEDALGRIATYDYDELGRKIRQTLPDPDAGGVLTSPVTEYEYDKVGNLRFVTDPLGNVTEYQYDARNRLILVIQPDPDAGGGLAAPELEYEYDDAGQMITMTDPLDRVTSYEYDNLGRLIELTQPDPDGVGGQSAPVTTYAYDAAGRKTSMTDALGNVTTYDYDLLDHLVEVTQPDPDGGGGLASPVSTWEYDAAGQLLTSTDPLSGETTYEYDNLGRTIKVTSPDPDGGGAQLAPWTVYTYDAVGNVLTTTDRLSHTTTYDYDNLYRLTGVTNANSEVTSYTYDAVGNRLTLTDPEDNTTTWVYDKLDRVTSDTNELSDARTFEYDAVGNLTKKTDRLGRVTQYTYDHLQRRTAELWKSGGSTIRTLSFAYDVASQLLSASDPAAAYDYEYDGLGRVTEVAADIDGLTPVVTLTQGYNALGMRTALTALIGSDKDFANTYTYDNLQRMTRVTQEDQSGGNVVADKRIDFAYNALGQFSTINRYASTNTSEFVASSTFSYDYTHRLTSLAHAQNLTNLAGYDYTYDAASRITAIDSVIDDVTAYTHDDSGQLTDADHIGQADEAYTYDDNGNRIMAGHTVDPNNRLVSDGTYNYEYDDEGNRTAKVTIATSARTEYTWDYRNRLTKITFKNSGGTVLKTVDQAYDVNNQWVRSTYDSNGPTSGGISDRFFIYDGSQIALEFDNTAGSDVSHRYLWGPNVDQLFADEQVTSTGSAGSVIWPLTDHLGTARDLVTYNASTDVATNANHRRYDSFGNVVSETNSAVDLLFGFTGRAYDENSGLQNNLNRWYDAVTGQWLSEDPIGFDAGDANVRRYVGNNAISGLDATGLAEDSPSAGPDSPAYGSWSGCKSHDPFYWNAYRTKWGLATGYLNFLTPGRFSDLARRMMNRYQTGSHTSGDWVLTEGEMAELRPGNLSVLSNAEIAKWLNNSKGLAAIQNWEISRDVNVTGKSTATLPMTLGTFEVDYRGVIIVQPSGKWKFKGEIRFHDTYDFDHHDYEFFASPRNVQTACVRWMSNSSAAAFEVTSPWVRFEESQDGAAWHGDNLQPFGTIPVY